MGYFKECDIENLEALKSHFDLESWELTEDVAKYIKGAQQADKALKGVQTMLSEDFAKEWCIVVKANNPNKVIWKHQDSNQFRKLKAS